MMALEPWPVTLYLVNFALLFTHQVDSAYWREWELFHMPGGLQLNLLLNFVLLLVGLIGFVLVVQGADAGEAFALVLAAGGVFAFFIHAYFLLRGNASFRLPASVAILASLLVVSIAQAAVTLRALLG
jgi:Family of unknown function (DUF6713)